MEVYTTYDAINAFNTLFTEKNRLKTWKPMVHTQFTQQEVDNYEQKLRNINDDLHYIDHNLYDFMNFEVENDVIDFKYLKYLAQRHMHCITKYIESKGVNLGDIKLNILTILNEIVTDQVSEDYYKNTLEIYSDLIGNWRYYDDENDVYDLIDEAIKRGNIRLLYYIIFKEDDRFMDRIDDIKNTGT